VIRSLLRAALFLLPVSLFLPHLGEFAFQPGALYSDVLVSHYPNALFLQRTLREAGTVPLWSPAILSGYPFAANPLSGLAYLPGWAALLLPLPLGLNLALALHQVWGGVGMYRFLRAEGLPEAPALLGGLVFEAMPKLYAHVGAGHLSLVYAVAWMPWVLYLERRTSKGRLGWLVPGAGLGALAAADVRLAAYAGLLWAAYSARLFLGRAAGHRHGWAWLAGRCTNLLMAGLAAAPLLLPLAQYTRLTTRGQITVQDNLVLSLPPVQLVGLVVPNIGGAAEWLVYPGAAVMALALFVLAWPPARRRALFWLGLAAAGLVYALGDAVPGLDVVARLPGLSLLRVPPRALLLSGFGFAVLAAQAVHSLTTGPEQQAERGGAWAKRVIFAAAAFLGLFAAAAWLVVDQPLPRIQFTWGAVFFAAGGGLAGLAQSGKVKPGPLTVLLFGACLVDLLGVNGLSLAFRSPEQVRAQGSAAAEYLAAQGPPGSFRVYSPSYSIPQHLAAEYRLELSDGVDPLQLAAYAGFMRSATGVPDSGYSVTLPPFATGDPASDNQDYAPDPAELGLLNVLFLAAEFPLQDERLVLVAQFGATRIYRNLAALPRAWVQAPEGAPGERLHSSFGVTTRTNQVAARAKGPGLLVLSEIAYPGWEVSVDGVPAEIETAGGLLRGVRLETGEHQVVFTFRPRLFYLGLALAGLGWCGLLAWALAGRRSRRAESSPIPQRDSAG
jgi:hypothetical protein